MGLDTGRRLAAANPGIPLTVLRRARNTFGLELSAQTVALVGRFLEDGQPGRGDGPGKKEVA